MIRIWHPILLVLTVSLSQPTWAEETKETEEDWRSTCKEESMLAGLPMINRQYGLQDLYEWMYTKVTLSWKIGILELIASPSTTQISTKIKHFVLKST